MYEVGKVYYFKFERIIVGTDGNEYICLSDPNNPKKDITVKPYSFQKDWRNITPYLYCFCKRQDVYGRFQFELSRDALLEYLYEPNLGHYQYFIIDQKLKINNETDCVSISDPYGISQLYFPNNPEFFSLHNVGDEIKLYVEGIAPSAEGKNNAYLKFEQNIKQNKKTNVENVVIRDEKAVSVGVEDEHNEFKASIAFPAGDNKKDMEQQLSVLMQSIAGFMNKNGGNLYIGVNDSGEPYKDISEEFQYLNDDTNDKYIYKANEDHYKLKLINKIHQDLGGYAASLVDICFEKANNITYTVVKVEKAASIVWYQKTELYVRCGNSTRRMKGDNITNFILSRVNKKQFNDIANQPEITSQEENVQINNNDVQGQIAISTPILAPAKEKAWRYISLYKDGQWIFSKKSAGIQSDMITEIAIPKDHKKYVMMIAYASGKINAVELKDLLYGTGRNKNTLIPEDVRRNYGIKEDVDSVINVFCIKKEGLLLMQSELNGEVKVKAHKMEVVGTHKQLCAQGNKMIPDGVLTHISPIENGSIEKSAIEAMGIVVKDYERYGKNGVDKKKLQGKYQDLIDKIFQGQ